MSRDNAGTARSYLRAIESGTTGAALADFFTGDVEYEELPNRIFPKGRRANLTQMLEAASRGQHVLSSQRYEVLNALSTGDSVVLEVECTGTLKVAFGDLPIGKELRSRSAIFLEFRDGKIARQRNYDCYQPWS